MTKRPEGPAAVVGNFNIDYIIGTVEEMPRWGTERLVQEAAPRAAGAGGNTALALGKLGVPCLGVGNVGADAYGRMILSELRAYQVDVSHVAAIPEESTGVGFTILRSDGERAFLTYLASLRRFDDAALEQASEAIAYSGLVLLTGWNLMPAVSQGARKAFLSRCGERGQTTLLDPGWDVDDWSHGAAERLAEVLPLVDVFLPNAEEARAITGEADVYQAGRALLENGARTVIIKLGPDGSLYLDKEQLVREGGERITAVDTTGAGDAFNAGVILGLTRCLAPGDILKVAGRVAAHVVARSSDRYPRLEEVWP